MRDYFIILSLVVWYQHYKSTRRSREVALCLSIQSRVMCVISECVLATRYIVTTAGFFYSILLLLLPEFGHKHSGPVSFNMCSRSSLRKPTKDPFQISGYLRTFFALGVIVLSSNLILLCNRAGLSVSLIFFFS